MTTNLSNILATHDDSVRFGLVEIPRRSAMLLYYILRARYAGREYWSRPFEDGPAAALVDRLFVVPRMRDGRQVLAPTVHAERIREHLYRWVTSTQSRAHVARTERRRQVVA